mmetsp:Transcript_7433/g.14060  ORF Transcript_7433/g.14060 Transcript_7433/m.14060 type:complete len:355 (+) Transcript_7433:155-1219(+)
MIKVSISVLLFLVFIISIQWIVISCIVAYSHPQGGGGHNIPLFNNHHYVPMVKTMDTGLSSTQRQLSSTENYEGVAVTLMINAPKWFQRRYTTMVQNILDNTPSTWAVQIFYVPEGQSKFGLDINPGLLRLNSTIDRLIMTQIPDDLVKKLGMKVKKFYWTSEFLWKSMVAESVFVFSGNGAICSNSRITLLDDSALKVLQDFDYIGTPSRSRSEGGDGAFSFRKRSAMLSAIRTVPYNSDAAEDYYFIQALKSMNRNGGTYKVATKEETWLIGGIKNINEFKEDDGPPFIISGTLAHLDNDIRNIVLEMCPEVKRLFPSLHHPGCFGAHPNADACAKSICALQDPSIRGKVGC